MDQSKQHVVDFRSSLADGLIPLGDRSIPTEIHKAKFVELLATNLRGKPREWSEKNHTWTRYNVLTEILWYSRRPVSFTFRDDLLERVEVSTSDEATENWDYSVETQRYFAAKKIMVQSLGKESRSQETDTNMETVWDFGKQLVFVSCDARTGGSAIGLRTNLQSD